MTDGFYKQNISVALATKHGKEQAVSRPLRAGLGFRLVVPERIETDAFGTFTGEIERPGNALETALAKARLGMELTGLSLGLASEGRFGAHPTQRFAVGDFEWLVFVDHEHGFHVYEQITTTKTNFAHIRVPSFNDLKEFLSKVGFPSHAVVTRPNASGGESGIIYKGLQSIEVLKEAFGFCQNISLDKLVLVETDMRAHLNPTRMRVLRQLAVKLARRLRSVCQQCGTPGFGIVDAELGLECALCRLPTQLTRAEIHACPKCGYCEKHVLQSSNQKANPRYCQFCNP